MDWSTQSIFLLYNQIDVIGISKHCQKRMLESGISRLDIKNCVLNGGLIEEYPLTDGNNSEKSFPSCLMLGMKLNNNEVIHVVVGFNGHRILVISAYYPDLLHWEEDFKNRKGGNNNV